MSYQVKILNHPADLKLKIKASSPEELFKGAIEGMASIINTNNNKIRKPSSFTLQQDIHLSAFSQEQLLIDFVNQVLALSDIYNAVFPFCQIKTLNDNTLEATIFGYLVSEFNTEIKAATYHKVKIKQKGDTFEVIITFDL